MFIETYQLCSIFLSHITMKVYLLGNAAIAIDILEAGVVTGYPWTLASEIEEILAPFASKYGIPME